MFLQNILFNEINRICLMKLLASIGIALLLVACQPTKQARLVYPQGIYPQPEWTATELEQNIAIHHLSRNTHSSTHIIRLKNKESPHYHDFHDLNLSVLSGTSIIHFKDHQVELEAGDVIYIPKASYHWAENTSPNASVVFAIFSPAFDGKDKREAD